MNVGINGKRTNGSPIVKVSSSTPVIHQLDGSFTLVVTSSSSGSLPVVTPNVSVGRKITVGGGKVTKKVDIKEKGKDSEVTLESDLRNMVQAFGGNNPLEDCVKFLEIVIRQEMSAFLFLCDTACYWSGSRIVGLRECIYTLRNDKSFLSRLFKHLSSKDQQKILKTNQVGQKTALPSKTYLTEIKEILEDLDGSGLLESLIDFDLENVKVEKAHLGESNNKLNSAKYINYAKARSVSFARKLPQLQEWVSIHLQSQYKLSHSFMEVLAFLIYDFIAQIVDLSFLVKREKPGPPLLKFYDPRGSNPETCIPPPNSVALRKDEECNNVSEILVLASELEAKRLKTVTSTNRDDDSAYKSSPSLTQSDMQEAYHRMQNGCSPTLSFHHRAIKIRQLSFQY